VTDEHIEGNPRTLINRHQPPINLENLHFACDRLEGGVTVEGTKVVDGTEEFGVRTKDNTLPVARQ
jgi:hypothetical protein